MSVKINPLRRDTKKPAKQKRKAFAWLVLITLASIIIVPACFIHIGGGGEGNDFVFKHSDLLIGVYANCIIVMVLTASGVAVVMGVAFAILWATDTIKEGM